MKEIVVDLHGEVVMDAKKILERTIVNCPYDVKRIVVVHGYNGGTKLKNMVRDPNQLRSKRIKRRLASLNQGETILELY